MMGAAIEHRPKCFIASIGQEYLSGCKESIIAAIDDLTSHSCDVVFVGIHNICIQPFHGLGAMRNQAIIQALLRQMDYVLIIDNDIRLVDPTIVWKLMQTGKPVVTPWFDQRHCSLGDGVHRWYMVQNPTPEPHQGLVPLEWVAVNCILFATSVFNTVGPRLFTDPMITNEEQYIFDYLKLKGFQLWQDTDSIVEMLRPPTRFWDLIADGKNPNPNIHAKTYSEMTIQI